VIVRITQRLRFPRMRITPRLREQAAQLCSAYANNVAMMAVICDAIGVPWTGDATKLADEAYVHAF
jgi:hypothetical protein